MSRNLVDALKKGLSNCSPEIGNERNRPNAAISSSFQRVKMKSQMITPEWYQGGGRGEKSLSVRDVDDELRKGVSKCSSQRRIEGLTKYYHQQRVQRGAERRRVSRRSRLYRRRRSTKRERREKEEQAQAHLFGGALCRYEAYGFLFQSASGLLGPGNNRLIAAEYENNQISHGPCVRDAIPLHLADKLASTPK